MSWLDAIILGIIEGITEFLPVSSTGHLTIAEKLMGYSINDPSITAFTAIIQIGAILAAVLYFWTDIRRVAMSWVSGIFKKSARQDKNYKFGWAIILGSLPIAIVGLAFQDIIETTLRSMWWVAAGLFLWSFVLLWSDRLPKKTRSESDVTWRDTLFIGLMQCVALIPGVSRSGATIAAGLMAGFDRLSATRLSFFLGIPALAAAGLLQAVTKFDDIGSGTIGWGPTIFATIISFAVGYLTIAWLIKFISQNDFRLFVWYRIALSAAIISLLLTGTIGAV